MAEDRSSLFRLTGVVIVSAAVVIAAAMLGNAWVKSRGGAESMRVTGSARKAITSDFIIWNCTLTQEAPNQVAAYEALRQQAAKTVDYLKKKGLTDDEIIQKAVRTETLYAQVSGQSYVPENVFRQVEGYRLRMDIEVRSSKVDEVDGVSRSISELIAGGVDLESGYPQYIYTKIGEVKVEILAEAAADARRRAAEIAKAGGASLGSVKSARMSPLQITPIYDYSVSGDGINDLSSKEKAITAIVTLGFDL
jgi:hypothetical protein